MNVSKLNVSSLAPTMRRAIEAAQEKKAIDIIILDLAGLTSFTDYFLICSGTNHRQLRSISDEIESSLSKLQTKPAHVEGHPQGEWILIDYIDFVVHIFTPTSRCYYDLERLWGDAKKLTVVS